MHRIDGPGALPGGGFSAGDAQAGLQGTVLTPEWAFAIQEEIAAIIEAQGIPLDKGNNGQLLQALGVMGGMRNVLINPEFYHWQRHAGPAYQMTVASGEAKFGPDRWLCVGGGGAGESTVYSSNASGTGGSAALSTYGFGAGPREWSLKYSRLSADDTSDGYLAQRIENVWTLQGTSAVLSFWVSPLVGNFTIKARLRQHFGTGGTPSPDVLIEPVEVGGLTPPAFSWTQLVFHFDVPNLLGQTLGTDGNHYLELQLDFGSTVSQLSLKRAQLEQGQAPSGYEWRPRDLELAYCRRYYETSYERGTAPGTASARGALYAQQAGASTAALSNRYLVRKRALASHTWFDPETGTPGVVRHNGTLNTPLTPGATLSPDSFGRWTLVNSEPESELVAHFVAEAEL